MDNGHPVLRFAALVMGLVLVHSAHATEVFKWTDANGQVHFGDRLSAPSNGKKIDVRPQPYSGGQTVQEAASRASESGSAPSRKSSPNRLSKSKSRPVDPSRVGPGCQELVDQIAKVKPGTNWQSLYQKFDATCPGIAYECNNYRSHPEDNQCAWIERKGGNVMQTNSYK
jgi:hypothetical protein